MGDSGEREFAYSRIYVAINVTLAAVAVLLAAWSIRDSDWRGAIIALLFSVALGLHAWGSATRPCVSVLAEALVAYEGRRIISFADATEVRRTNPYSVQILYGDGSFTRLSLAFVAASERAAMVDEIGDRVRAQRLA